MTVSKYSKNVPITKSRMRYTKVTCEELRRQEVVLPRTLWSNDQDPALFVFRTLLCVTSFWSPLDLEAREDRNQACRSIWNSMQTICLWRKSNHPSSRACGEPFLKTTNVKIKHQNMYYNVESNTPLWAGSWKRAILVRPEAPSEKRLQYALVQQYAGPLFGQILAKQGYAPPLTWILYSSHLLAVSFAQNMSRAPG